MKMYDGSCAGDCYKCICQECNGNCAMNCLITCNTEENAKMTDNETHIVECDEFDRYIEE